MKLLLDESIPRQLVSDFPDTVEVTTVQKMDWAGTKNGVLLGLAAESGFDALVTADKGIEYPAQSGVNSAACCSFDSGIEHGGKISNC